MQDRPKNDDIDADYNKLVDIEKLFHEQSKIIEDIIDKKKSLTHREMSQYLVTLNELSTQIIRLYKKYAPDLENEFADELTTIANANESDSDSDSEIEIDDDAQRILDLLEKIQEGIDITFDVVNEYAVNISSPDKDKGDEIKPVKPTKSRLNSPAASIQIAGTTQKVTADITLANLENLNQLPENQQERSKKIVKQILFAMDMIENGLQIDSSNQLIQMNNFPRNLQKAIIAYCTHMGYAYQSNVKFNSKEKNDMIADFISHLDTTPDLKQRIDEKKQAMLVAEREEVVIIPPKQVPDEAVKNIQERLLSIQKDNPEKDQRIKNIFSEVTDINLLYQVANNIFSDWEQQRPNELLLRYSDSFLCGYLYRELARREMEAGTYDLLNARLAIPEQLNALHKIMIRHAQFIGRDIESFTNVVVTQLNLVCEAQAIEKPESLTPEEIHDRYAEIDANNPVKQKWDMQISYLPDASKPEFEKLAYAAILGSKYQSITLDIKNPDRVKNSPEYIHAVSQLAKSAGVQYEPKKKQTTNVVRQQINDMHVISLDDVQNDTQTPVKDKLKKIFPKTAGFFEKQKSKREEKSQSTPNPSTFFRTKTKKAKKSVSETPANSNRKVRQKK